MMTKEVLIPSPEDVYERISEWPSNSVFQLVATSLQGLWEARCPDMRPTAESINETSAILVENVQLAAYHEYKHAEHEVGGTVLAEVFMPLAGPNPTPEEFAPSVLELLWSLDRFFLGLTQGRRPRAGNTFEIVIRGSLPAARLSVYPASRNQWHSRLRTPLH